ncbi:GSCFA family [Rubellimicrobium thermophilum DSM 16684]|uniref:GSCFA family n=1 Tax=Rubellimicrobium thermophilum DSM 16684 TaxID=1123069 RepID=S9R1A6_9RHOB|nr:GSCFA domain-containing protein [Rubellimicrobium thermophilum]EPX87456.1 GSCFA family [Rubellimicrobium thermophilum DSM 16684]
MSSEGHPIERLTADQAMLRARRNDLRRYPSPERDGERLYPLASPTVTPSFRIEEGDTIFAIGSCFARNVEKALESAGRRVLSREFDLGEIGASLEDPANFFNKYSIHSVLNEVRWALERETYPGAEAIYEVGPGRYVDAQLGMARLDFPIETILAFRHRYLDAMAAVAHADVLILTLGYVETWFDRKLGLYLNVVPPTQLIKAEPERFEFRVLSYGDVLAGLNDLHALLLRHRTRPLKMLVTVSPVPLLATFRDMDVLVANAYSKSVQRAALEEFVMGKEGVDYFPSYEFVTLSNPAVAWSRGDYRHVSADVVTRIMDDVLRRYVGGDSAAAGSLSPEALRSTVRMLSRLGHHEEMIALCARHRDLADADAEVLLLEAASARRLDRLEEAFGALAKAQALAPDRPDALERMILLCRPMRQKARARELLARHAQTFPGRSGFREKVTWI